MLDNEMRLAVIHRAERQLEMVRAGLAISRGILDAFKRTEGAREMALAVTKMEETEMWLNRSIEVARKEMFG